MEFVAIILSVVSLLIAATSLGWNIYRDVVLKPRVKVSVSKSSVGSEGRGLKDHLMISAVNYGPGKVQLNIIRFLHSARLLKKQKHGVLIHDYTNPLSSKLPATLEVGEEVHYLFPWDAENLCSRSPSQIGIRDSFSRTHWAPSKEVKKVNYEWQQSFADESV